jgi:hypothetical protein
MIGRELQTCQSPKSNKLRLAHSAMLEFHSLSNDRHVSKRQMVTNDLLHERDEHEAEGQSPQVKSKSSP